MYKTVRSYVLGPLTTRVGTWLAGGLAAYGIHSDYAHGLALGAMSIMLIVCDLALAYLRKKKIIADTLGHAGLAVSAEGLYYHTDPRPKDGN